jgi:hypothetical protein
LLLEAELGDTSGDPITIVDDVQKVGGDHVDQPGDNHAVHAGQDEVLRKWGVAEDVVLQSKSSQDEEHVATPFGEV